MKKDKLWFKNYDISFLESFWFNILNHGPIPKHIAIIMDGNRRYAKFHKLSNYIAYELGFEKLIKAKRWCFLLGANEVTIFAFSIENFKRNKEEVDLLMNLALEKFNNLLEEKDDLMKNEICVRFIGNLNLLPVKLQCLIGEIMILTQFNKKYFLNICIAYTAQYEISNAVDRLCLAQSQGLINKSNITKDVLKACLYTHNDPDLLIRTSGEIRLSDFLLWQSNFTILSFVNILWPECTLYDFFKIIFNYQITIFKKPKILKIISLDDENKIKKLKNFINVLNYNELKKMKEMKTKQIKLKLFERKQF